MSTKFVMPLAGWCLSTELGPDLMPYQDYQDYTGVGGGSQGFYDSSGNYSMTVVSNPAVSGGNGLVNLATYVYTQGANETGLNDGTTYLTASGEIQIASGASYVALTGTPGQAVTAKLKPYFMRTANWSRSINNNGSGGYFSNETDLSNWVMTLTSALFDSLGVPWGFGAFYNLGANTYAISGGALQLTQTYNLNGTGTTWYGGRRQYIMAPNIKWCVDAGNCYGISPTCCGKNYLLDFFPPGAAGNLYVGNTACAGYSSLCGSNPP